MGHLVYCHMCRCPVKCFDLSNDHLACEHGIENADYDVWWHGYDHGFDGWNRDHPDRPIGENTIYGPSPYMKGVIMDVYLGGIFDDE